MKKRITEKRAKALAEAVNGIDAWALIGALLRDDQWEHSTDEDLHSIASDLLRHYPHRVQPDDVMNAWDWFRIHGEDWGAEALAVKRGLDRTDLWLCRDWLRARERAEEAWEVICEYVPAWPSEPLPGPVLDAFDGLPPSRGLFVNSVPLASERARGNAAFSAPRSAPDLSLAHVDQR